MKGSRAGFLNSALNRALLVCKAVYLYSYFGVMRFNEMNKLPLPANQHPTVSLKGALTEDILLLQASSVSGFRFRNAGAFNHDAFLPRTVRRNAADRNCKPAIIAGRRRWLIAERDIYPAAPY
jgi:hypothetical protein